MSEFVEFYKKVWAVLVQSWVRVWSAVSASVRGLMERIESLTYRGQNRVRARRQRAFEATISEMFEAAGHIRSPMDPNMVEIRCISCGRNYGRFVYAYPTCSGRPVQPLSQLVTGLETTLYQGAAIKTKKNRKPKSKLKVVALEDLFREVPAKKKVKAKKKTKAKRKP